MNEQYYLPLAYLNAWEYCPRRFFLEYELGENADNEHLIIGRHLHRNVDEEGKKVEGDKVIYRHQWVWSDRLLINGIIDAVEEKDNQLIPLEFKKGRMANHKSDHFQLCGAALCLEERTGGSIPYGEIFYYVNRRRERVDFTSTLREATEQAISAARVAIGRPMPPPIDALVYALELGMPVHYLSCFGKYLGSALPGYSRNGQLRLSQYAAYCNEAHRLEIVKTIVTGKIHNQHTVLYRHDQKDNPLKSRKQLVKEKTSLDEVRGVEGLAAREYFAAWSVMLEEQWSFNGRNRRPPTDAVNALLGFAYGLLQVQVTAAVHIAGLDPYVGYLHEATRGQPAMVLDLMEEFRPLIADNLILSVITHKEIKPNDFTDNLGAYRLSESGRKQFLQAWERKMNDEFKHPSFGYRCSYRRAIELQARLLSRHLQEGVPYKALTLR